MEAPRYFAATGAMLTTRQHFGSQKGPPIDLYLFLSLGSLIATITQVKV